jgi:hypothetical protein
MSGADHRRWRCERCSFWSDRLTVHQGGTMFALCLNENSPKYTTYTGEGDGCYEFLAGEPIDRLNKEQA